MKAHLLVTMATALLITDCREDDLEPVHMIANGDVESGVGMPSSWVYSNGSGNYNVEWDDAVYHSGSRSLRISTETQSPDTFSFWGQQKCTDIPRGKTITLKAMVKGNLVGQGISIAIRCDDTSTQTGYGLQFVTTQGNTSITGTFDWKEYSIEIGEVVQATTCIWIFLVYLPSTSGEVYFDDVSLVHY